MGAELVLTYNGEDVASLGRSHEYYRDILMEMQDRHSVYGKVFNKLGEAKYQFIKEMFLHIMALKPDDIDGMNQTIGTIVEWYQDECLRAGRTLAVIDSIDEYSDLKLEESI